MIRHPSSTHSSGQQCTGRSIPGYPNLLEDFGKGPSLTGEMLMCQRIFDLIFRVFLESKMQLPRSDKPTDEGDFWARGPETQI